MLIPGTFTICPRAVANYAHRIARIYASQTTSYRLAFQWGMREATRFAMGVREIAIADAGHPAEVLALRNEILFRECQSQITDADRTKIRDLKNQLFELELRLSVAALDMAA